MRSIFWIAFALVGIACGDPPQEGATSPQKQGAQVPQARGVDALSQGELEQAVDAQPGVVPSGIRPAPLTAISEELVGGEEAENSVPCVLNQPAPAAELLDPDLWKKTAPENYTVRLDTTAGPVTVQVTRSWSPLAADRFYNLVQSDYLSDIAWFRVVPDFVVQGGMHGDPAVNQAWSDATIKDDPVVESNLRGMLSFATSGKDSRSNQFFINFKDNTRLDGMGFSPFARVVQGMEIVDSFYSSHPDIPDQEQIGDRGSAYLCSKYPKLDRILTASVVD